jgi:hypothetical protein
MRKSSSINSFLISIYFSLFNIVANPRMGIVCRIFVCVVLNVVAFPCFSMVYCIDDVIIGSESSLNSETVALETKPPGPISNKENIPTLTHHIIAVSSLLIIAGVIIWRLFKGDSSAANASNPVLLIRNN